MISSFPNFDLLSIEHSEEIKKRTCIFLPYSDYTFLSLWCWNDQGKCRISTLNDNLVIQFSDYISQQIFLSFLGKNQFTATAKSLLEYAVEKDFMNCLQLVPEDNFSQENEQDFRIHEDLNNHDYVYEIEKLTIMQGKNYRAHRNFINRFHKRYLWFSQVMDLSSPETWEKIQQLQKTWEALKLENNNMSVTADILALEKLRHIASDFPLVAIGVYVDDKLSGYTINELNHGGYATNLFENADNRFVGIFRVLKQETAKQLREMGYQYWNHQQDWGLEGLHQSKKSFLPSRYLKKYKVEQYYK